MEKQFICDGTKYIFGHETISLPVSFEDLPATLEIENNQLLLKSTFHISLVPIGKLIKKFDIADANFKDSVINDFCNFVKDNEISLIKYRNEFRFVTQNERKSIVLMAEVSNLRKFFEALNKKYTLNAEVPPTHVTLYTLQPDVGIFIVDSQDLNQLTRMIENPLKSVRFRSN